MSAKLCRFRSTFIGQLCSVGQHIDCYEQQLKIARKIGDKNGEATALWNMSLELHAHGNIAQADEFAVQALEIYSKIESPYAETVRTRLSQWRGSGLPGQV